MNPTLRTILTGLAGFIVANVTIYLIESLGHLVYPPPQGLDYTDSAAMAIYVQGLPLGALLFVLFGWTSGVVAGGILTRFMMPSRTFVLTLVIGLLIEIAAIVNLNMIPHPSWFAIAAHVAIPTVTILVGVLLRPR